MRVFIFITILFYSVSTSAQTKQAIAKSNCKSYLLRHLNDPNSYRAVNWSTLDVEKTEFDEAKYQAVNRKAIGGIDDLKHNVTNRMTEREWKIGKDSTKKDSIYREYVEMWKQLDHTADSVQKNTEVAISKAKLNFKSGFRNYYIEHTFRAKNQFNALRLSTYYFILDKNLKVVAAGDVEERDAERTKLLNEIEALEKKYGQ